MARVCVLPAWLAQMAPRCAVRAFPRWHPNCPDIGSLLPSRHRGKDAEAENGIWGASSSPRGWRCAGCGSGAWSVRLWTSMDFFGRTCCRGRKTRLQLRSSLATSAKKVFGKQRLTRLVNVSFPAPNSKGSSGFPFFLVQRNHPIFSDCVALVRWDVALRRRPGYAAGQHALGGWRPDGEIGRHCGLKIRRFLKRGVPVRSRLGAPLRFNHVKLQRSLRNSCPRAGAVAGRCQF